VHKAIFEASEGKDHHWWFPMWQQLDKFISFSIPKDSSHGLMD
jgi:hypothetical protein